MSGPFALPPGTCDTHLHFYDAAYPTAPTTVLRPPDATVAGYRALQAELGVERLVVVQPTTYGLDNRCQLAAMAHVAGVVQALQAGSGVAVEFQLIGHVMPPALPAPGHRDSHWY